VNKCDTLIAKKADILFQKPKQSASEFTHFKYLLRLLVLKLCVLEIFQTKTNTA